MTIGLLLDFLVFSKRTAFGIGEVVVVVAVVLVVSGARVVSVHEYFSHGHPPMQFSLKNNWQMTSVMLVTTFCWWLNDGDRFKMLLTESLCWRLFSFFMLLIFQCIKSVTNTFRLQHPSPTSMSPIWFQNNYRIKINLTGTFQLSCPEVVIAISCTIGVSFAIKKTAADFKTVFFHTFHPIFVRFLYLKSYLWVLILVKMSYSVKKVTSHWHTGFGQPSHPSGHSSPHGQS